MLICHEGHLTGGSNLITALITTNVPDKDRQVEREATREREKGTRVLLHMPEGLG